MYEDKLYMTYCPKTKVLTVKSNNTIPLSQKINFGYWYNVCNKKDEVHFEVQIIKEGKDNYVFNVQGLDEIDQPEDYNISDILNNQDFRIVDENGVSTGSLVSV